MMDKEYDDEKNATLKLKKCLFEICKTNFDRSSALDQLIIKHSPLVVDVFGDNPFDVMPELLDFYDYNDYENPENGECRSFAQCGFECYLTFMFVLNDVAYDGHA